LANAGFALFPTFYCFSENDTPDPQTSLRPERVASVEAELPHVLQLLRGWQQHKVRFSYSDEEWESQFLERPGGTEFLKIGNSAWCVVEAVGEFDRLQALVISTDAEIEDCIPAILGWSMDRQRKLFLFSNIPAWRELCVRLHMGIVPGFLYTLCVDHDRLGKALGINAAPPERTSSSLMDPSSPWYLGEWSVQSGDRM
jgi:hypothetical protein